MSSNLERAREDLAKKVQELVANNETKPEGSDNLNTEIHSEAEVDTSTSEQISPELSEVEKQAYALGWRPQSEYQGSHFVPADEYVRRQPLFERIDKQSRELRELRDMNRQIADHLSMLRKEAYDQALRELESRRIQAINEGDSSKTLTTERQIKEIEQRQSTDPLVQAAPAPTPAPVPTASSDALAFQEKNANWFNSNTSENRRMMEAALLVDRQLAEQAAERGVTLNPKEHLKMVEDSIRKNFPHRFENPKKDAPAMVGKSTSSADGSKTGTLVARLTPEQRRLGEFFQRSNKSYTLEKYAQDLERMGRLQ